MAKKPTLTAEQRTQLMLRLLSKEEPTAQIALRARVSEQTLYRWCEDFINGSQQAMNECGAQAEQAERVKRLSAEIAEQDQVIGDSFALRP